MRRKVNLADKSEAISLLKQLYGPTPPKPPQNSTISNEHHQDSYRSRDCCGKPRKGFKKDFENEGEKDRCKSERNRGSV